MPETPTPRQFRLAFDARQCPWCHAPLDSSETTVCPACGHNTRSPRGPRDPGSPGIAVLCSILALILTIAVAVIQQNVGSLIAQKPAPTVTTAISSPSGQFEITAKVFAKIQAFYSDPSMPSAGRDPKMRATLGARAVGTLEDQAGTPLDHLRVAMFAGEVLSTDDAITRLDAVQHDLTADSPLIEDCTILRSLYAGEPINAAGQLRLETNHGWIGRLAATHGKPDSDPERAPLVGGGGELLVLCMVAVVGAGLVLITGLVCCIIAIVKASSGTLPPRFVPPTPGGSIAIEMVVIFILGFLALKGLSIFAESFLGPTGAVWFSLIAQWCLLFILLWPKLRGSKNGLAPLGWNTGQGVFTEIGCGIFGYLACLPLVVIGAIVSVMLMFLYQTIKMALGHKAPPAPDNPIFEIASGKGGLGIIVVIYFLASIWAPIMEETIFRGALYRHLRSCWPWFPAAAVSAIAFGLMHNYPLLMLGPVMSLGFGFALIREWRGSLIASMTAHCIHNAVVLGFVLIAVHFLGS